MRRPVVCCPFDSPQTTETLLFLLYFPTLPPSRHLISNATLRVMTVFIVIKDDTIILFFFFQFFFWIRTALMTGYDVTKFMHERKFWSHFKCQRCQPHVDYNDQIRQKKPALAYTWIMVLLLLFSQLYNTTTTAQRWNDETGCSPGNIPSAFPLIATKYPWDEEEVWRRHSNSIRFCLLFIFMFDGLL